jgi:hypothetical protein
MKKNIQDLYNKYNELFDKEISIECNNGWYKILDELLGKIKLIIIHSGLTIYINQVKEKFGTLRVYFSIESNSNISNKDNEKWYNIIECVIANAESKSGTVCELTGNYGKLCSNGAWVKTLSKEKADELGYIYKEPNY